MQEETARRYKEYMTKKLDMIFEGSIFIFDDVEEAPVVNTSKYDSRLGVHYAGFDNGYNYYTVGLESKVFYTQVGDFCDGIARAAGSGIGAYYYVDEIGKRINDEVYDDAEDFHEGLAAVKKGGKWFYIDRNGKRVNNEEYDEAGNFYKGIARVKRDGKCFYITKNATELHYREAIGMENGAIKVKKNGKYNVVNYETGELLFPRWYDNIDAVYDSLGKVIPGYFLTLSSFGAYPQLQIVHDGKIETLIIVGKLVVTNNLFIADNVVKSRINEMKDYEIFRGLSGYRCKSSTDNFKIKYQPIKCYGTKYVLCVNDKQMYLYNRDNNSYIPLGDCKNIEYDDNIIKDGTNNKIYLIYDGNFVDITEYYHEHLEGKEIHITDGIKGIMSEEEFFVHNFTDIDEAVEAKKRKNREEKRRKEKTNERNNKLKEVKVAKEQMRQQEEKDREAEDEALKELREAIIEFAKVQQELKGASIEINFDDRLDVSNIFIRENDHLVITPILVDLIKYINLKNFSFDNVQVSGIDFRGCNLGILFDPQKVYQKNLRGCNFDKVDLLIFSMNFTGVDIRGCHFNGEVDSSAYYEFPMSFINAI